jgi:hypothetical protein
MRDRRGRGARSGASPAGLGWSCLSERRLEFCIEMLAQSGI